MNKFSSKDTHVFVENSLSMGWCVCDKWGKDMATWAVGGHWIRGQELGSILASAPGALCFRSKTFDFSLPQFPFQENGDNNSYLDDGRKS